MNEIESKPARTIVSISITAGAGTPSQAKLGEGATDHELTVLVAGVVLVAGGECDECRGTGKTDGHDYPAVDCHHCNGTGRLTGLDDIAAVGDTGTVTGTVTLVGGEIPWQAGDIRGVARGQLVELLGEVPNLKAVEAAVVLACAEPGKIQEVTFPASL